MLPRDIGNFCQQAIQRFAGGFFFLFGTSSQITAVLNPFV